MTTSKKYDLSLYKFVQLNEIKLLTTTTIVVVNRKNLISNYLTLVIDNYYRTTIENTKSNRAGLDRISERYNTVTYITI